MKWMVGSGGPHSRVAPWKSIKSRLDPFLRILVTAGPTVEPIDPVRFLSNRSSGAMGFAIARAARARGHRVELVVGPTALPPPAGIPCRRVETARDMLHASLRAFRNADALVMAAAVADWRPARAAVVKRPKRKRGKGSFRLALLPNPDILAILCARRTKGKRIAVGFALENRLSPSALRSAQAKLRAKRCDAIVLNGLDAIGSTSPYRAWLVKRREGRGGGGGAVERLGPTKRAAAGAIVRWIERATPFSGQPSV